MLVVDEYNYCRQQQREDMYTNAYLSAYWQRVKRMPSLKEVLESIQPKESEEQTPDEMFEAVKRLQAKLDREGG